MAYFRLPHKMAVLSPAGEVKVVSPVSIFVLNTGLTLKKVQFFNLVTMVYLKCVVQYVVIHVS